MNLGKRCARRHVLLLRERLGAPTHARRVEASRALRRRASSDRGRGSLFGTTEVEETTSYDPERLERQNDAEIEGINERAKHLKEVSVPSRKRALYARALYASR